MPCHIIQEHAARVTAIWRKRDTAQGVRYFAYCDECAANLKPVPYFKRIEEPTDHDGIRSMPWTTDAYGYHYGKTMQFLMIRKATRS